MLTKKLIPTDGVYITENFSPKGFLAGRYDSRGFASEQRWFSTLAAAEAYADTLK